METFTLSEKMVDSLYPNCFNWELSLIPATEMPVTDTSGSQEQTEGKKYILKASFDFNTQWESLLNGRVQFGINGGRCVLQCGEGANFYPHKALEETPEMTSENILYQWRFDESSDRLGWLLESKLTQERLMGTIENCQLGTFVLEKETPPITVSFTVEPHNIRIVQVEGLWKHDITPNQYGVLERMLAKYMANEWITPYLSQGKWFEDSPFVKKEVTKTALNSLQYLIDGIIQSTTNRFVELSILAHLDPLKDFAGAALVGTHLIEVDFSGGNLAGVNLRGAELNDADLSDANLKGAKLSGADLTGAFLENADLSYCDLHKASLALVNLAGVNLTGANLQETNLSSTIWTDTIVTGAKFSHNTGLTDEVKSRLMAQGAIFE